MLYVICFKYVVTKQKFTEWEITKTEVGNEIETFITPSYE